jgi:pyridinium-3,5-biscarboxylic acid mononucleotide sulfurtransferase
VEMPRLIEEEMSRRVTDGLRKIGYAYVTIDLLGYRSGSMNEGFFKKKKPTETH